MNNTLPGTEPAAVVLTAMTMNRLSGLGVLWSPDPGTRLVGPSKTLSIEILGDELPVHDAGQNRGCEPRPLITIVDVISVLPHIEREEWHHPFVNDWGVRIVERGATQRSRVEDEPRPAV